MVTLAGLISRIIDLFYLPPFRKIIPIQTFRYAFCGGMNLVLSWVLYYLFFHFVFCESNFDLGFVVISPHIAALIAVFPITLLTGFALNKYVTFKHSPLRGRTQLIRYILSVCGSLVLDYALMKVFVETVHIFPTPSKIISSLLVTIYSYLMQKYFTFSRCENI